MSAGLGEGIRIVAKMTAISDDGSPVAIAWLAFNEEDDGAATAYEILQGGRIAPCDLGPLSQWRRLAALTAAEGGK